MAPESLLGEYSTKAIESDMPIEAPETRKKDDSLPSHGNRTKCPVVPLLRVINLPNTGTVVESV